MKNKLSITLILVLILAILWVSKDRFENQSCELQEDLVCFNLENDQYEFEPNPSVLIRVPTEDTKKQLTDLWQQIYPTKPNVIQFTVAETPLVNQVETIGEDIFLLDHHSAAFVLDFLYPLDTKLMSYTNYQVNTQLASELNVNENKFIVAFIDAPTLIIDKTVLNDYNLSLNDLATFENIQRSFSQLSIAFEVVFPLVLDNFESIYPFLTAGGWHPFDEFESTQANFDSKEFLEGLKFVETLGDYVWDDKNPSNNPTQFTWQYDTVLVENKSPISITQPYVDLDVIQNLTSHEYQYTAYPSVNNHKLNHLVEVEGWVMHQNTRHPSTAHEVLKFLRTPQATEIITNTSNKIPAIKTKHLIKLNIPKPIFQQAIAHNQGHTKPAVALRNNPNKLLWDVFDDIEITQIIQDVYSKKRTPEQAQQTIIEKYQQWLEVNQ